MNTLKRNIVMGLIIMALATTVSASSPSVGNVAPGDGATIDSTLSQLDDQSVELAVDATHPDEEDVNVTFYTEVGDVIGENASAGPRYTFSWDVDQFREYNWYAEAIDSDENTTTSDVRSFQVTNSDNIPPSVSFYSIPDGTTLDGDVSVGVRTDEDAKLEYRVDGGAFTNVAGGFRQDFDVRIEGLDSGDHTVTVRAEDRAGNTQTNSFSLGVADGSEVDFQVGVDKSYPGSGIPIDPDSDVFDRDADVDFDFSLERNGESYDISNDVNDGVCDFRGDPGWQLGADYFCGSKVPTDITTGAAYELVAEWSLRDGSQTRVLDDNFQISETAQWYSQSTSHGGKVQGSIGGNMHVEGDSVERNGKIFACKGSSYKVDSIGTVTARCSNGYATGGKTPPVVSFVTTPNGATVKRNNDMFNDPDCSIEGGITRQDLFDIRSDQGYYPEGCGIGWTLGGDNSFTAYTFNQPGQYSVAVDHVNAVSDSPQYICPADSNNGMCSTGTLNGASGWKNLEKETVSIIEPRVEVGQLSLSQDVVAEKTNGRTYIRRKGYTGDIAGTIDIKNTGTGNIEVTGLTFDCPSGVDCRSVSDLDLVGEIAEGETSVIDWKADVPDGRMTGLINVTVQYEDSYGVGCPITGTPTRTYYLDEANPETDQGAN
jgi:hypothetical protein